MRTDDTKLVRIARKLSRLEPKVQRRNFPSVEQIQDGSFEIFPSKLKKFENPLKLPVLLFSISLIIYSETLHNEYKMPFNFFALGLNCTKKLPRLSWIFCVKRVYGFSFRMLSHTPKKSPPHSAKNPLDSSPKLVLPLT